MTTLVTWMLIVSAAAGSLLAGRSLMHYFQLESYQFPGYFRTLRRNLVRAALPGVLMTVYLTALFLVHRTMDRYAGNGLRFVLAVALAALALLGGWWCRGVFNGRKEKKPFVITARVKRLYLIGLLLYTAVCAIMAYTLPREYLCCLFPLLLPLWTALAGLLASPVEKLIHEMYFRDAQKKLAARPDLIKIGITGSYGKTSVKFILGTLLSEKYQTLVTPSSYNTPMGVTRVIREKLQPAHQVFVAEMGARHVGDIKELCRLVHPHYGVLTSVGPQHLDTFHTLERIKSTKYELMDAVPKDGCCFFVDDGGTCRELFEKTQKEKRLCGLHPADDVDVWASDVTVSPAGSHFTLHTATDSVACETRLLGEHNIQNILLAATVCLHLGLSLRQIAHGIGHLAPVEHRLQLIPSRGVTIIDDAFNSNPHGARAALHVLAGFPGRRIIITPGMVELGGKEDKYNRDFGRQIAQSADVAILVGKRHTQPIVDGLNEKGFPKKEVYVVGTLDEAAALLGKIGRPGDVALFENDLPDNYSEA